MAMFDHEDILAALNKKIPLHEKLHYVHGVLKQRYDFISRVAVAIYDPKTDILKTFIDSNGKKRPLERYQSRLSEVQSLREILEAGRPRVVDNLDIFGDKGHHHTDKLREQGYRASYTMPMFMNGNFFGFIFFNSTEKNPFSAECLHYLDIFGHLASLIVISEISSIHTLLAALKTARSMTHHRDIETGVHLDRMSRYARLIAKDMAEEFGFDDEYIEHVFLFAPLHDIGKIGIPDRILLKPDKLSDTEYASMKEHVKMGQQIIDDMLGNFGLESFQHIDVLRNIALYHHEAIDGSGYPNGLEGEEIPVESRIVAVADVFDALTSRRPYKLPWSNDEAFEALHKLAGLQLDARCVAALEKNRIDVEKIQQCFEEDRYG